MSLFVQLEMMPAYFYDYKKEADHKESSHVVYDIYLDVCHSQCSEPASIYSNHFAR